MGRVARTGGDGGRRDGGDAPDLRIALCRLNVYRPQGDVLACGKEDALAWLNGEGRASGAGAVGEGGITKKTVSIEEAHRGSDAGVLLPLYEGATESTAHSLPACPRPSLYSMIQTARGRPCSLSREVPQPWETRHH